MFLERFLPFLNCPNFSFGIYEELKFQFWLELELQIPQNIQNTYFFSIFRKDNSDLGHCVVLKIHIEG